MEKSFICSCCSPSKAFVYKRGLRKHESKYSESYVHGGSNVERNLAYEQHPRCCIVCENAISYQQFKNGNRFCGSVCAAKYNNNRLGTGLLNDHEIKYGHVGNLDERRRQSIKRLIDAWMEDPSIASNANGDLKKIFREHVLLIAGHQCSQCGWGKRNQTTGRVPLHVDHIDGDWTNNIVSNLRVLCPNCHSLTPTYGSLNRGKGRRSARQQS